MPNDDQNQGFLKFSITVQVLQVLQANGCQNNVQANFLCNQIKAKPKVQKKSLQNEIKLDKNKAHCIVSFTSMKLCKQEHQKFFEYPFLFDGGRPQFGWTLGHITKAVYSCSSCIMRRYRNTLISSII